MFRHTCRNVRVDIHEKYADMHVDMHIGMDTLASNAGGPYLLCVVHRVVSDTVGALSR